jgi:hypothetical protein
MRIPQSYIQKCKVVAHIFQSIFIFVGLCVTISVFTKEGKTGGATKYYLALVRCYNPRVPNSSPTYSHLQPHPSPLPRCRV